MESILEDINKIVLKLLSHSNADDMYQTIVEEGKKIISCEYGSIFLENDRKLKRVYASDPVFFHVKPRQEGLIAMALKSKEPNVVVVEKTKNIKPIFRELKIKSIILIPLSYKGETTGVLTLLSRREVVLSAKEKNVLKLISSMSSLAIKKVQLYEETKKALETRDLFISLASHELRTPLTSINGYVQLLHNKFAQKKTMEAKWICSLYEESQRMTNLIKELLEINKIKQGQLQFHLEECNLEKILSAVIERFTFINKNKQIIYKKEINRDRIIIIGDVEKLIQMFSALLNNADKFSARHTPIEILLKNTKTQAIISIKDQGEGIISKDQQKVFDGFYKSGDRESSGLGVGLLLSKHIVQYHHGSISLKSKLKRGTSVEVRLPLLD